MKSVVLTNYGDPVRSLECRELPEPEQPGSGQVLVGVEFSPINFSDILVARGLYPVRPEPPSVIGIEGVGRVLKLGAQVGGLRVGDRVALPIGRSVWRQRMIVPATELIVLPEDADPEQLSMVSINPPTAHLLLETYVELRPGDWIAINAANSAIARWLIGFGKRKGIKIIGLVRRPQVLDEVHAAGCDLALLDNDDAPPKWRSARRPATAFGARRGQWRCERTTRQAPRARWQARVLCGPSFAPLTISPFDVIFNDLTVRGFSLLNPAFAEQIPKAIREAARMIASHEVTVPIAAIYPLDEIKRAVAHALQGGKILLEAGGARS